MELLEALKTIREECEKHICRNCPMRTHNDRCAIREKFPSDWKLRCDGIPRLFN